MKSRLTKTLLWRGFFSSQSLAVRPGRRFTFLKRGLGLCRDKCVPHSLQKRMHAALPCGNVMTIDTDHSPFFSAPERLVECLCSIISQRASAA